MGAQSQSRTHDDVVQNSGARIDQEMAAFGCLDNASQIAGIDLLNHHPGSFAEKVTCTDRITVTTSHVMALTNE
jgi:hypothetical protein